MKIYGDSLQFDCTKVHPSATTNLIFHRTLRIPDNSDTHKLPPSIGRFPLQEVDKYRDRVPEGWLKHGGIFLPMYQAEAAWIEFQGVMDYTRRVPYPFAIKVSAGMRSAVTGEEWQEGLREKDYMVAPPQPWIDGFCVEKGKIRQFVAAPLGQGFTVEAQLTGKETFGGLQIEVFPMKREVFEEKFPVRPQVRSGTIRSRAFKSGGASGQSFGGSSNYSAHSIQMFSDGPPGVYAATMSLSAGDVQFNGGLERLSMAMNVDMGMAAGGSMTQEILADPYDMSVWDTENGERCFVHLCNSLGYQIVTGKNPPYPPPSPTFYKNQGYPWFDSYTDDTKALEGSSILANLQTLTELGWQKGFHLLLDNAPLTGTPAVEGSTVKGPRPGHVRDGDWS